MEDTMYDKLGGEPTFQVLVDRFYQSCLSDSVVKKFFHKDLVTYLRIQLQSFLAHVFGKRQYNGKSLRAAHSHLKIKNKHFDRIIALLEQELGKLLWEKMGPDTHKDIIQNTVESVIDVAETTRNDILGVMDDGEQPDDD